jgi:hypothetical protein
MLYRLTLPAINRRGFLVQRNHLTKKSLRHLDQRWDSPPQVLLPRGDAARTSRALPAQRTGFQALTFRGKSGSCIAASPVLIESRPRSA